LKCCSEKLTKGALHGDLSKIDGVSRKTKGAFTCVQILPPTSQPVSASPYRRNYRRETYT
jgi:hypothetical protein